MLEAPRADSEALSALRENRSGSYFATHRWYDPGPGRWTTPDPAKSPCYNLFDYVRQRAVIGLDPTGLEDEDSGAIPEGLKDAAQEAGEDTLELDRAALKTPEGSQARTRAELKANKARADFVAWSNLIRQARTLKKLFSKACKDKVRSDAESAFDKLDKDAEDYCKEHTKAMNAMISGRNCCDKIATAMAKSITQAMWDRLKKSGQREFGNAGNVRSKESFLGKRIYPDWCDCGEWANLVRNNYSSGFSLSLLRECADHLPKQWDMFRGENTDHPHNWTRFCWGNHCVDVDPWKEGHADGSVSSGASFDRATASGEDERTAEWAE